MSVKMEDIAKKLDLSKATVSLALNDREGVNIQTKQLVKQTAREMGYYPNRIAKSLSDQQNKSIGIIIPDISNPYYGNLVKSISDSIDGYCGYHSVFAISNDKPDQEEKIIGHFISERVAGVIIAPTNNHQADHSYIRRLEQYNIRYGFITSYYADVQAPYVMVDLEEGSYQLTSYLLDMGHRNIYFMGADPGLVPTHTRISGYKKAFAQRNIPQDDGLILDCRVASFEQAYIITNQLLSKGADMDAIITINDIMALGALRALAEKGVEVPEALSVAGYDNVVFSTISAIPLTTVHQDIERMSRAMVDMLFSMIDNGQEYEQRILIQPELILRRSTARKSRR